MLIGVPKEIKREEYRVALTPAGAEALTQAGHQVIEDPGQRRSVVRRPPRAATRSQFAPQRFLVHAISVAEAGPPRRHEAGSSPRSPAG